MLRSKNDLYNLFDILVIPVEIGILTVSLSTYKAITEQELFFLLIITFGIIVAFFTKYMSKIKDEINFIEDFIEVIFPGSK